LSFLNRLLEEGFVSLFDIFHFLLIFFIRLLLVLPYSVLLLYQLYYYHPVQPFVLDVRYNKTKSYFCELYESAELFVLLPLARRHHAAALEMMMMTMMMIVMIERCRCRFVL
jgi:hypothetical protein